MIWRLFRELTAAGVLGMNMRNMEYIARLNPRSKQLSVNDKLETKKLALTAGFPVPALYGVIEKPFEVNLFTQMVQDQPSFVIKPCRGSGGDGIVVIQGRRGLAYVKSNDQLLSEAELKYHISNTIAGMYSQGGRPDRVIIEAKVTTQSVLKQLAYKGVPDIRIIVYRGVPVMSMLRLPTLQSDGKANLHKGGIGAAIDICRGITQQGVMLGQVVNHHPDTGKSIEGLRIPRWKSLLKLASSAALSTGLGYVGVDIVLDQKLGPLILEMNARPGLAIQIANQRGLLMRLNVVDAKLKQINSVASSDEGVAFALAHFKNPAKK